MRSRLKDYDVLVHDHGTLITFELQSIDAKAWALECVDVQPGMETNSGFHCERRFAMGIAGGMEKAGIEVMWM